MISALTRILVVDEHPVIVSGLARLIAAEPDWQMVRGVASCDEAMVELERQPVDLIILEPAVRGMDGLGAIGALAARARVLCFSAHREDVLAERCLRAGARGYLMKTRPPEEIAEAIRTVLGGGIVLSEAVRRSVVGRLTGATVAEPVPGLVALNNRELQVVHLLGHNRNSRQIAVHLRVSEKTIATHRQRIREKLALRHGNDLVRIAARWVEVAELS